MKRIVSLVLLLFSVALHAANPRWVAGSQWTNVGKPIVWYRSNVQYFVDAGPLSSSVNHAAAVAMIDAAAAVWNIPNVSLTLTDGGSLAEDVSADNVYVGTNGLIWPQDVASTNYTAVPIAIVLDADGSVTDALLGSGASAPSSCMTNGVTEAVDLFIQPGKIAHAVVVVNGRCSGPAPEQQLQLRYQLMRVFGRVLGVGWSQVNDNVFTGTPTPTYLQQMHWPIMHPIDIICGPYTYQCLPQPFTLREDDIGAMWLLYGATSAYASGGVMSAYGTLSFPGGIPMGGVNLTLRRYQLWGAYGTDPYQSTATVSGYNMAGDRGNPVTGASADTQGVYGPTAAAASASFNFGGIFLTTGASIDIESEAVNPLYVGSHAVGSYRMGSPSLSGAALSNFRKGQFGPGGGTYAFYTATDAASDCTTGQDGAENAPAPLSQDGTWSGRLCGIGHTSWMAFAVKANRTATVEVTATDANNSASTLKAMPLIGVWNASDATGSLPGIARQTVAFNAVRNGMTQLRVPFTTTESVRLAVTDARGDGRPDYTYRARVLYADSVSPARLASAGGSIVITGMGFATGNTVTVGGVAATIVSISPTQIRAVAPTLQAIGSSGAKDIAVNDLSTGGSTTMSGAIVYAGASSDALAITAQPGASVAVGAQATLALQLMDSSGAPVRSGEINVSATSGSVMLGICNLPQCTLVTDANGMAQTSVTPSAAGSITLSATSAGGSTVQASFTATTVAYALTMLRPTEYVASGSGATFAPAVQVTANGSAAANQSVNWTASTSRAGLSSALSTSNGSGLSSVAAAGSLRDGEAATVQACAWSTVCGTQNLVGVAAANLRAAVVSGDAQNLTATGSLSNVALRVLDASGHPVAGASVALYQTVAGWQPPCATGRCGIAPVYGTASSSAVSDDDGLVKVAPLQYANTAAVTKITASVGTQGTITVTLVKSP